MGRGGKREGAGRHKGSRNKLTKEAQAAVSKALAAEVTPLTVMRGTMEALWADALEPAPGAKKDDPAQPRKLDIAKAMKAHEVAKDVAPYVHPKLQSIEGVPDKPVGILTDQVSEYERARRVAFMLVNAARVGSAEPAAPRKPEAKGQPTPARRTTARA